MKSIIIILNIVISLYIVEFTTASPDLTHYENWYNSDKHNVYFEFGFNSLKYLNNFIQFKVFLYLLVTLNTILITLGLYRYSNSNFNVLIVFLFLPFLALNSGITLRQNLALGLFLNSNFLFNLLSPFFHVTSLAALFVSNFSLLKNYKKWVFLLILITTFFYLDSIVKIILSEILLKKFEIYSSAKESSSIRVFTWIIFLIYFIKTSKNKLYNTYAFVSIFFIALSYFNPQFQRISWFFIPIIVMMIINHKGLTFRKVISFTFLFFNFLFFLL